MLASPGSPKWGIVGCGNISRFHFNGLMKAGATIAHIADLRPEAAQPWVEATGARFSTDYGDLIADPEVTVVDVLTDSRYHHPIVMAALAAGKDVVCEKTLMDNAAEATDVARTALAANRLFFTAYMKRFFPMVQKAKELLPLLGRLFSGHVRAYQKWGNYYEVAEGNPAGWVIDKYGGAVIKCAASHMIDMTLHLLGRPQSLYAHVDYIPQSSFDRKALALFEYPGGLAVTLEAATHPLERIGYERNSWDERVELNGVNGRLELYFVRWDQPENNGALLVHYDNATEAATEYRFAPVNPFDLELAHINGCLARREQSHPDVVDGFNVDVIIEAMVESGRRRAALDLDWQGL
jgi:predicted dehydrogenase